MPNEYPEVGVFDPRLKVSSCLLFTCTTVRSFSAGSFSGQMSVIQSVVVPPSTLPETSLPPKKQPPSEYIRTWTPFGCSKYFP